MEHKIRKHIEGLFSRAPVTPKARELREEMIVNVIERYHDHLAAGMSEEDAYRAAITGIGDVSGLIDSLRRETEPHTGGRDAGQAYAGQPRAPYAAPVQAQSRRGLSTGAVVAIVICATILLLMLMGSIIALRITGQIFSGDGLIANILRWDSGKGGGLSLGGFHFDNDEGFDNAYVETGSYTVPAEGINAIAVNWVTGDVRILAAPEGETQIAFTEEADGTVSQKYALRYGVSGGKLTIRFCDSSFWRSIDWNDLFNARKTPQKKLTLYLPASLLGGGLKNLNVDSVSNTLEVEGLQLADASFQTVSGAIWAGSSSFKELRLTSVSGDVTLEACTGERVRFEGVSGKAKLGGAFSRYDLEAVSGGIEADVRAAQGGVEAQTVSGEITLTAGGEYGFTASVDTVSGKFSSGDLPVSIENGRYVYGDGAARFKLETVSGNITLR